MGLTTPLHDDHKRLGARLVDFAGWEMPLHYGSQIEEHQAVRRDAGMFDVSHMLAVDLAGSGTREFLRRVLANDVAKLAMPGKALYSCMLNPEGGVIDDLIAYFFSEDRFRLVVNAGTAEKDVAWLRKQAEAHSEGVTLAPRRDLAMIALQGPNAIDRLREARAALAAGAVGLKPFNALADGDTMLARTGYTGEDGVEIIAPPEEIRSLWRDLEAVGVRPAGLGARDTLRLEAGMNLYGQDMDETTSPVESGLAWTIDTTQSRNFIGRQALAAARPALHMLGLVLEDKGVLRAHQKVLTASGEGEITSGSFSPTMGKSIALARLPLSVAAGDSVSVDIRGRTLATRVVRPPFVRRGKILV